MHSPTYFSSQKIRQRNDSLSLFTLGVTLIGWWLSAIKVTPFFDGVTLIGLWFFDFDRSLIGLISTCMLLCMHRCVCMETLQIRYHPCLPVVQSKKKTAALHRYKILKYMHGCMFILVPAKQIYRKLFYHHNKENKSPKVEW